MKFNDKRVEVELHIHLDGAFRPSTIYRFAKKNGINLPGSSAEEFERNLLVTQPKSLKLFLEKFDYIIPPVMGDKVVLFSFSCYECSTQCFRISIIMFFSRKR